MGGGVWNFTSQKSSRKLTRLHVSFCPKNWPRHTCTFELIAVVTADGGVSRRKYKGLEDTPKDMRNTQTLFTRYPTAYRGRSTLRVAVKR